jgi:hypothetical protein
MPGNIVRFGQGSRLLLIGLRPTRLVSKVLKKEKFDYFWKVSQLIYRRVDLLCNLPFDKLDRLRLEHATKEIGKAEPKNSAT